MNSSLLGLDQLYTGRAGGSSRGNGFNIIFSNLSQCAQRGLVVMLWPSVLKVLSSITGSTCFSFSSCLVFVLVVAVLFFFLYISTATFFRFINFLPYCLISLSIHLPAIPPKSFARSCDLRLSSLKCERVLFFSNDKLVGFSSPRLKSIPRFSAMHCPTLEHVPHSLYRLKIGL